MRLASYTANNLNQYTSRTVPGAVDIIGSATNTATVTVNDQATYRKGNFYRAQLPLNNTFNAVYAAVTNLAVLNQGTSEDIVTNIIGNIFLPQTPEAYTYDADGNLLSDGRWNYTWDGENRLVSQQSLSTAPSGSQLRLDYTYDAKGRRVQKMVSTWDGAEYLPQSTNKFVYDGWNLCVQTDCNNVATETFLWGTDLSGSQQGAGGVGGLLAISTPTNAAFVSYDGNGNVTALVSTNGTLNSQYEYGPFGEVIRASGPMAKANPLRFSTKYQDDESDLLCYGFRYYKPSTGSWIGRDPAGEGDDEPNLYGFIRNEPLSHFDAFGLCGNGQSCGFEIEASLHRTLDNINVTFAGWTIPQQLRACHALLDKGSGAALKTWDIMELQSKGGKGKMVGCDRTVTFKGKCYYGGAANYAMFGRAMSLCDQRFPDSFYDIGTAISAVIYYKTRYQGGFKTEEAREAIPFTIYGFNYGNATFRDAYPGSGTAPCDPNTAKDPVSMYHWHWHPIKNSFY